MPTTVAVCGRCMDGACGFCLTGWPAVPLACGCHTVTETTTPLFCPQCRADTNRIRITSPGCAGRTEVECCTNRRCRWERRVA